MNNSLNKLHKENSATIDQIYNNNEIEKQKESKLWNNKLSEN